MAYFVEIFKKICYKYSIKENKYTKIKGVNNGRQ